MKHINVLDRNLSNMIAAGEVVERPASAVKELVENSIDSGAKAITVEIKKGGKSYIRVTDNGCGMSRFDAQNCFLRHATSKISTVKDLFNISTMGFRGEALAAISAVSKVELLTFDNKTQYGTRVMINGGNEILCEDVGVPVGTTMIVRDLFYNTPARMNFMKKDATETAAVVSLINKFAVGNPNISFKLIVDNKQVLMTDSNSSYKDVVFSVFGSEISEQLFEIDRKEDNTAIIGFAASPKCSRSNRNYQYFYVNDRIVKSKTITAAVDRAYKNLLMNGKYAVVIINLKLPYDSVDVNVHPTKTEVKFKNENNVFNLVYYAIKTALEKEHQMNEEVTKFTETSYNHFEFDEPIEEPTNISFSFLNTPVKLSNDDTNVDEIKYESINNYSDAISTPNLFPKYEATGIGASLMDSGYFDSFDGDNDEKSFYSYSNKKEIAEKELSKAIKDELNDTYLMKDSIPFRYVGELFKTYIIIECTSSYFLIDKHAAHERILFDKIYERYLNDDNYSQTLMFNTPISLSPEEGALAREHSDKLYRMGYVFDDFGDYDVIVRCVPYMISPADVSASFTEILSILAENGEIGLTEFENKAIKTLACKAAIKAGFESSGQELENFVQQLLENRDVKYCPHGRPIFCEFTKESIEKAFKRIV